jgi:hypothetical protein
MGVRPGRASLPAALYLNLGCWAVHVYLILGVVSAQDPCAPALAAAALPLAQHSARLPLPHHPRHPRRGHQQRAATMYARTHALVMHT